MRQVFSKRFLQFLKQLKKNHGWKEITVNYWRIVERRNYRYEMIEDSEKYTEKQNIEWTDIVHNFYC